MDNVLIEFMRSLLEILRQIGEHPHVTYPFGCVLLMVICYIFFRNGKTPRPLTLAAFIAALVVLVGLSLLSSFPLPSHADPASGAPSHYYSYAGPGDHAGQGDDQQFVVGYFQFSENQNQWTDTVLKNITPGPNNNLNITNNGTQHNYSPVGIRGKTLQLQRIHQGPEKVIIELNLEHGRISYIDNDETKYLYDIISGSQ